LGCSNNAKDSIHVAMPVCEQAICDVAALLQAIKVLVQ
jgi:hypothetical protein